MKTRLVILRCRHGPHTLMSSALPFVTKVRNTVINWNDCYLYVHSMQIRNEAVTGKLLYTGATIRHCHMFMLKRQKLILETVRKLLKKTKLTEEQSSEILTLRHIDPF